jgi:hypothetical protein
MSETLLLYYSRAARTDHELGASNEVQHLLTSGTIQLSSALCQNLGLPCFYTRTLRRWAPSR